MDQSEPQRDQAPRETSLVDLVKAPPMRIVTKGWWWRPDEEATVEELAKANREEVERLKRRRGPFGWW